MWAEHRNGKWRYSERYRDHLGKVRRVSVTLERKADKKAYRMLQDLIEERTREAGDRTLSEVLQLYLEDHRRNVRKATFIRNKISLEHTIEILGGYNRIGKLTAGYIREQLARSGKPASTCNGYIKRLSAFIRWAYRNDYITDTACIDKLERFADTPHREKIREKFMDDSELNLFLSSVTDEPNKLVTEFLVLSGLRIGEAIALNDADVTDVIRVTKTYSPTANEITPGKTFSSRRDVHIQPELSAVIDRLREAMRLRKIATGYKGPLFLIGRNGGLFQYHAFNKWMRENTEQILGRRLTPHSLRHTHASLLLERGMPIDAISRRLGHDGSRITQDVYLHLTDKIKEQDARKMDSLPPICPQ